MELKQLEIILKRHGIKVGSNFANKKTQIRFASPQVESKYDYVLEAITDTVVNGRTPICKKNVKKLADISVGLQQEDALYMLTTYDKSIKEEIESIRKKSVSTKMEEQLMIKNELIKYIQNTLAGIEVCKIKSPREQYQDRYDALEAGEKVLQEIKDIVLIAPDCKSSFAAKSATAIATQVYEWGQYVVNQQLNKNKIDILNKAKEQAVAWSEKKISFLTRNAKEEEIFKEEKAYNPFEYIIKVDRLMLDYATFKASLQAKQESNANTYGATIEKLSNTIKEYGDKIAKLREEKGEKENEINRLSMKANNEALSADEIESMFNELTTNKEIIESLVEQIEEYENMKESCSTDKTDVEQQLAIEKIKIDQLLFVIGKMDAYKDDEEIFVILSENFDYVTMTKIARGTATEEEIKTVMNAIEVTKAQIGTTKESTMAWINANKANRQKDKEARRKAREQARAGKENVGGNTIEEKLAMLKAGGSQKRGVTQQVEQNVETNKINPLGTDEF